MAARKLLAASPARLLADHGAEFEKFVRAQEQKDAARVSELWTKCLTLAVRAARGTDPRAAWEFQFLATHYFDDPYEIGWCSVQILRGIYAYGFERPTFHQEGSWNSVLCGNDVVIRGTAQGGKLSACIIPILCLLPPSPPDENEAKRLAACWALRQAKLMLALDHCQTSVVSAQAVSDTIPADDTSCGPSNPCGLPARWTLHGAVPPVLRVGHPAQAGPLALFVASSPRHCHRLTTTIRCLSEYMKLSVHAILPHESHVDCVACPTATVIVTTADVAARCAVPFDRVSFLAVSNAALLQREQLTMLVSLVPPSCQRIFVGLWVPDELALAPCNEKALLDRLDPHLPPALASLVVHYGESLLRAPIFVERGRLDDLSLLPDVTFRRVVHCVPRDDTLSAAVEAVRSQPEFDDRVAMMIICPRHQVVQVAGVLERHGICVHTVGEGADDDKTDLNAVDGVIVAPREQLWCSNIFRVTHVVWLSPPQTLHEYALGATLRRRRGRKAASLVAAPATWSLPALDIQVRHHTS